MLFVFYFLYLFASIIFDLDINIFSYKYCCKNANCIYTQHSQHLCTHTLTVAFLFSIFPLILVLFCLSTTFNGWLFKRINIKYYQYVTVPKSYLPLTYYIRKLRDLWSVMASEKAWGFNRPRCTSEHFSSTCTAFIAFHSWHSWWICSIWMLYEIVISPDENNSIGLVCALFFFFVLSAGHTREMGCYEYNQGGFKGCGIVLLVGRWVGRK